jgi:hypothetical protein
MARSPSRSGDVLGTGTTEKSKAYRSDCPFGTIKVIDAPALTLIPCL